MGWFSFVFKFKVSNFCTVAPLSSARLDTAVLHSLTQSVFYVGCVIVLSTQQSHILF